MKRFFSRLIVATVFLLIIFVLPKTKIQASVVGVPYFGGLVTGETVCDTGLLIYVKDAISTPPFFEVVPYMWFTGELPFMNHVIPHPGQELLGAALPATIPCIVGYIPVGYGFPIVFHGDSL